MVTRKFYHFLFIVVGSLVSIVCLLIPNNIYSELGLHETRTRFLFTFIGYLILLLGTCLDYYYQEDNNNSITIDWWKSLETISVLGGMYIFIFSFTLIPNTIIKVSGLIIFTIGIVLRLGFVSKKFIFTLYKPYYLNIGKNIIVLLITAWFVLLIFVYFMTSNAPPETWTILGRFFNTASGSPLTQVRDHIQTYFSYTESQ